MSARRSVIYFCIIFLIFVLYFGSLIFDEEYLLFPKLISTVERCGIVVNSYVFIGIALLI